ncbi:Uncharacterized [Syntrophomonas zehnderi OL-4]|uniref:Uncharacterized n=1 Tax=Syntrophomonas zehnderi OL-4 TaxID=690567 RepID=A0A0E4GEI4_9FIRM|nr:hypothetical protein [Syntrophomonas zehnderi]CFX90231.1 Uncharacterized [Syntrophomonas zehnderi OL-4]
MNKGDLFTVYMDGAMMTVCVIGSYKEEYSGEEMVILAIVSQDNMVHVPLEDLDMLIPRRKFMN